MQSCWKQYKHYKKIVHLDRFDSVEMYNYRGWSRSSNKVTFRLALECARRECSQYTHAHTHSSLRRGAPVTYKSLVFRALNTNITQISGLLRLQTPKKNMWTAAILCLTALAAVVSAQPPDCSDLGFGGRSQSFPGIYYMLCMIMSLPFSTIVSYNNYVLFPL